MNIRARLAAVTANMEVLRSEIADLDALDEPTDEQTARFAAAISEWDTAKAERDELTPQVDALDAIRNAALDPRNVESEPTPPQVRTVRSPFENLDGIRAGLVPPTDMIARAKTAIEQSDVDDSAKENAYRLVSADPRIAQTALITGNPAYHRAFETYLRNPQHYAAMLDDEEREALRAAMSLTSANGGYAIPFLLDPAVVIANTGSSNPFRQISRVERGTADKWNGLTSAGVNAQWLAEATAATDASPTFAQPSVTAAKAAAWIVGSYEVFQSTDLASAIPALVGDAKDRIESAAFAVGSGSGAPKGVITAVTAVTASRVSPTTGGAFGAVSEVYKVINAVQPRYRARSSWLANFATYNLIRGFDTYGGGGFWTDLNGGLPPRLVGLPTYESSEMTSTVTTGSNILLAGDFSHYLIYDVIGSTTLEYVQNVVSSSGAPTGQRGWFATWRVGGDVVAADAFRVLKL